MVNQQALQSLDFVRATLIIVLELPYKSPLQPYTAWATGFILIVIIFFSGNI